MVILNFFLLYHCIGGDVVKGADGVGAVGGDGGAAC